MEIPLQLLCNDLEGVNGTEDSNYIEVGRQHNHTGTLECGVCEMSHIGSRHVT